ncbi:hypothetical protein TRVL_04552 [Trypanosoma vivax]|nr:hypothetical protein TRVL_04552 [Trypanosoma vivax]
MCLCFFPFALVPPLSSLFDPCPLLLSAEWSCSPPIPFLFFDPPCIICYSVCTLCFSVHTSSLLGHLFRSNYGVYFHFAYLHTRHADRHRPEHLLLPHVLSCCLSPRTGFPCFHFILFTLRPHVAVFFPLCLIGNARAYKLPRLDAHCNTALSCASSPSCPRLPETPFHLALIGKHAVLMQAKLLVRSQGSSRCCSDSSPHTRISGRRSSCEKDFVPHVCSLAPTRSGRNAKPSTLRPGRDVTACLRRLCVSSVARPLRLPPTR